MSDEYNKTIAELLAKFATDPAYAQLIGQARDFNWQTASAEAKKQMSDKFMSSPMGQQAASTALSFGFPTWGWGGVVSASAVIGAGGGGGYLTNNAEGRGVGFTFGSLGLSIGGAVDFAFLNYRGKPSEFWGLFTGAYGQVHAGVGVGVFGGGLGVNPSDPRWQVLIFPVGVGLSLGAGGFAGWAWV